MKWPSNSRRFHNLVNELSSFTKQWLQKATQITGSIYHSFELTTSFILRSHLWIYKASEPAYNDFGKATTVRSASNERLQAVVAQSTIRLSGSRALRRQTWLYPFIKPIDANSCVVLRSYVWLNEVLKPGRHIVDGSTSVWSTSTIKMAI